ncbi:MAG: MAPEG family protein [Polyangiaceae bacterium]
MTIAFWCLPVAFLLIYASKIPVAIAQVKAGGGRYDNHHPRDQQAALTGWGKRAISAHLNGFEGFAGFAAAVLVAHAAGGNAHTADVLAVAYVVTRVLYVGLYLADVATLRSAVWAVGLFATLWLFVLPAFG